MFYKAGHESADEEKVIIYGAGDDGILTFITLMNAGIYVSAFCDMDCRKQKMRIMNKRVMSPTELDSCEDKEHIIIFIGSRNYRQEIKNNLYKMGFKEIYENRGEFQNKISIGKCYRYGSRTWYTIIEQSYKKHIFIFGTSGLDLIFAEKLRMTDIKIEALIVENTYDESDLEYPLISVSELASYPKEKIMVYILEDISKRVKLLEKRGYRNGYHYRMAPYIYGGHRITNPYHRLDVTTGFSYVDSENTPGYSVIGDEDNYEYIIMILGASATDQHYHYFPSWVDFYKDNLKESGIRVKIFNGGGQAYSTQQNLLRLIRDLPVISPDLVVDYDGGINAMNLVQEERLFRLRQPFSNSYTEKVLSSLSPPRRVYIKEDLLHEIYGIEECTEICVGMQQGTIKDVVSVSAENYLYAIKCMHAICMVQGVKFLNFLDPLMVYSEFLGMKDKEKLFHDDDFFKIRKMRESACRLRKEIIEGMDSSFQTDLTQILRQDDMYEDIWHPNEKGNQIIARHIYEKTMQVLRQN